MSQRNVTLAMLIAVTVPAMVSAVDLPRPPEPERRSGTYRHYTAHEIWHLQFDELVVVSRRMTSVREYDEYGRLVVETPRIADIRTTEAAYAAEMQLVTQTRYTYDDVGRVTQVQRLDPRSPGLTLFRYVAEASAVDADDPVAPGDPGMVSVEWYDPELNPLRVTVFANGQESRRRQFTYEDGAITSIDTYDQAGRRTARTRYRYTADPRSIVKEHYQQDGNLTLTERIVTDDSGRVIRRNLERADDSPVQEHRYEYRVDGAYSITSTHGDSEVVQQYASDGRPTNAQQRAADTREETSIQEIQTEVGRLQVRVVDTYVTKFGEAYIESRTTQYDWTIPFEDAAWTMSGQAGFPHRSSQRTGTQVIEFDAMASDCSMHEFDATKLLEGTRNHMLVEYRAEQPQKWSVERTIETLLVDQMPTGILVAVRAR